MYIEYPTNTVTGVLTTSWHIGTPVNKLPEQICTIQADGDELVYALQFVPHDDTVQQVTSRVVKFYGLSAYRIIRGINEDYALPKVQRFHVDPHTVPGAQITGGGGF